MSSTRKFIINSALKSAENASVNGFRMKDVNKRRNINRDVSSSLFLGNKSSSEEQRRGYAGRHLVNV